MIKNDLKSGFRLAIIWEGFLLSFQFINMILGGLIWLFAIFVILPIGIAIIYLLIPVFQQGEVNQCKIMERQNDWPSWEAWGCVKIHNVPGWQKKLDDFWKERERQINLKADMKKYQQ